MNRKQRRATSKNPNPIGGFNVISAPAAPGHGCQWCPCTAAEEAAHPEWHDPNRCPRNCTADADVEVAFGGRASGARFSMLVCDEHSVSVRLLFVEKVTHALARHPMSATVTIAARDLRDDDVLAFGAIIGGRVIDGLPITKLHRHPDGRIEIDVAHIDGTTRFKNFGPLDEVSVQLPRGGAR